MSNVVSLTPPDDLSHNQRDALASMLRDYCIVRVGKDVAVAFWKDTLTPGGHELPCLQLVRVSSFKTFHADKEITITRHNPVLNRNDTDTISVANVFIRQAKRYDGIVYAPGMPDVVGNDLNMWRGFGITPRRGDWSLILRHIYEVLTNRDPEQTKYVVKWLAWAIQNPGTQAEVALVIQGAKGTGKGLFGRAFLRIFGSHGTHVSSSEHLVGKHNFHLKHCSAMFVDEAFWAGDRRHEGALKRNITEPTLSIEPKGIDMFEVRNCLHIIIAGNDEWIVPATEGERRYAVLDVSNHRKGDFAYFTALAHQIDNGGLNAMMYDLMRMDLKKWHPRMGVPQTASLQRQKTRTIEGTDAIVEYLCQEGQLPCRSPKYPNRCAINGAEYGGGLLRYAKANSFKGTYHLTPTTFKTELIHRWGCKPCKVGRGEGLAFPPLGDLRARFIELYGPQPDGWRRLIQDWDDGADDDEEDIPKFGSKTPRGGVVE